MQSCCAVLPCALQRAHDDDDDDPPHRSLTSRIRSTRRILPTDHRLHLATRCSVAAMPWYPTLPTCHCLMSLPRTLPWELGRCTPHNRLLCRNEPTLCTLAVGQLRSTPSTIHLRPLTMRADLLSSMRHMQPVRTRQLSPSVVVVVVVVVPL